MQILVCPIKKLKEKVNTEETGRCAAIILSSYDLSASRIPDIPYVFRKFEDLDREVPGRSFSEADAIAVRDFLRYLDPRTETLICCCDAAQSRSPAAAAAISLYYRFDDLPIWREPRYHPNAFLFSVLCRCLGITLSDLQIDYRIYENRKSFQQAIRNTR